MIKVFQEGLSAAKSGASHDVNPYEIGTEAYDKWANGWLVGDDPLVWGHLTPSLDGQDHSALLRMMAEAYGVDPEETVWEAGRKAAQTDGDHSDNPYDPETVNWDEWDRGFKHGTAMAVQAEAEALPLAHVKILPTRAFWAVLNNMQIERVKSVQELAAFVGVDEDRLRAEMAYHGFYDVDGIPLYEVVAA